MTSNDLAELITNLYDIEVTHLIRKIAAAQFIVKLQNLFVLHEAREFNT